MPSHAGNAARAVRALLLCLSLSLLSSCGGGGSGSSSAASGAEPAIPQPDYKGSREIATLDTTSAANLEQVLAVAVNFLEQNAGASSFEFDHKTYNETDKGVSGTVTLTGTVNPDGTGWVQQVFSNYESKFFPGQVETGTWIVESTESGSVLGVRDLSVKAGGETFVYNGTITTHAETVTGNMTIDQGNDTVFISDLTVTNPLVSVTDRNTNVSVSGRVYDSARGYATVATPIRGNIGTFSGDFLDLFPEGGTGQVTLTGKSGSTLTVEPLGDGFIFLGLDADGDGKIESGARMPRETGKLDLVQPAGTHVLAMAEIPAQTATGSITVDGRYSYTPGGFVNYKWSLLAAPLGSTATVSGDEPTVQITPDVAGQYLLELTASAAGSSVSSIDVIPVSSALGKIPATPQKVPGYIYAHAGQSVTIDGRVTDFGDTSPNQTTGYWSLHAPVGSHAKLSSSKGDMPSFTPDIAGLYYVTAGGGGDPSNTSVVAVDTPVRFAWPTEIIQSGAQSPVIGRFGGSVDGFAFQVSQIGTAGIQWWQPATDGLFTSGSLTSSTDDTSDLLTTDLNGDGVSDFVTPTFGGVSGCPLDLWVSSSGSYTSSSAALATPCPVTGMSMVRAGTFGGKPGLVFAGHYNSSSSIVALVEDGTGTLQAPVVTALQGVSTSDFVTDVQLGDFTGDGISDAAVGIHLASSSTNILQIYKGDASGAFTFLASYTLASGDNFDSGPVAVGDFNGDGKQDVAVIALHTLHVLYGDGTGAFPSSNLRNIRVQTDDLTAVDLDGDHKTDLITSLGNAIGVFFGSATGIGNENDYALPNQDGTGELVSGDLNGSGLPYLLLKGSIDGLLYAPTLPAITSATITSVDSAEVRVSSALSKRTAAMAQSPWVEHATPLAHVRLDLGSPPRK